MSEIFLVIVLIALAFSDRERTMFYYHKLTGSAGDVRAHIIHNIVKQMRAGGISLAELTQALEQDSAIETTAAKGSAVTKLFAILGGIFVLAGVGTYVGMFWDNMGPVGHVIVSLGLGIALTIFGITAIRENKYPRIVVPVLIAAALFCASGGFVLLHEMYPRGENPTKATLVVFTFMALHQLIVYQFYPRSLTVAFGMFFLYGAFASALDLAGVSWRVTALLLGGSLLFASHGLGKSKFSALTPLCILISAIWFNTGIYDWVDELADDKWALIITGISVFSLGVGLSIAAESNIDGPLYLFGTGMFLCGLFDLVDRTPYDLIFLLVSMGLVYVSVLLKSRAVLLTSTLSILTFIGYYADLYFIDSIGLPVALILAGFIFIGISAGALRIKKKYF